MKNIANKYKAFNTTIIIWTLLWTLIIPIQAKPEPVNTLFNQDDTEHKNVVKTAGNNSVYFEENQGQFDERVKYFARGTNGHSLFLTATEAVYVLRSPKSKAQSSKSEVQNPTLDTGLRTQDSKGVAVFMKLVGANENAISNGLHETQHKTNYFKGKESDWRTDIPNYKQVRMGNVYEGIDTLWQGKENGGIQFDFVVQPNVSPNQIEWEIEGAESIEIDEKGSLNINTDFGKLTHEKPKTYQVVNNFRQEIESRFEMKSNNRIGLVIGEYDDSKKLLIDSQNPPKQRLTNEELTGTSPLEFSTLLGGSEFEITPSIEVGADGKIYVAGTSKSPDFPQTTGGDPDDEDIFISVFNSNGTSLLASTIIGSDGDDFGNDMKFDSLNGWVYVTGSTRNIQGGDSFPTTNTAYDQTENGGFDAIIMIYKPFGNQLIYSSLLGGENLDEGHAIVVDNSGSIYIAGSSQTAQIMAHPFPTTAGAYDQNHNGETDVFIAKMTLSSAPNEHLVYSTFIGGAVTEKPNDIALDANNNVIITGITGDGGLFGSYPTTQGSYDGSYNGGLSDAFVTKLNATGSALIFSTFIGGQDYDESKAMTFDSFGNIFLTGTTDSSSFPTTSGVFDETHNGSIDAFVTKMNANGSQIIFSTFLGGLDQDSGQAIELDGIGNILVGGEAQSQTFPITPNSYDASITGFNEAFLTRFNSDASEITYSTFIGGGSDDKISDIKVINPTTILFAGETNLDPDNGIVYPTTTGAYDTTFNGFGDVFLTRFKLPPSISLSTGAPFDFDGDTRSDISIFRPNVGEWWYLRSSDGGNRAFQFGTSTDILTPADFTGDGKTDIAIFRPAQGEWFVLRSEDSSFYSFPFGASDDIPSPADFDGDGKADPAVFRPVNATWFILNSSGGTTIQGFGINGDKPAVADYDGDGKADIAIYRPSNSQWWLNRSSSGVIAYQFGTSGDQTVQGDYTGDNKADVAFWRPSTAEWYILRSEDSTFFAFPFGVSTDIPSPGDYDGDGRTDAAVFRPSNNTWFIQQSTAGTMIQSFGTTGDKPIPNVYVNQ